ncbi:unnamed protein product [Alternaria alternata]
MADPFSITGSAVGVVSIAIQLCKDLNWYVSGVKDAEDKVESIAAYTEKLTNVLDSLETIVAKVDPSQAVSTTLTGIASCAEAIVTIRKKLKLDDPASSGGFKSNLKKLGKRMAFPFKEAEIESWKGALDTIHQSLQTALCALMIDQQRLASEHIGLRFTQLSLGQAAQHQSSLQLQHEIFDKAQLQLTENSQVVERGFTTTAQNIHSLHADVHLIQDTMQDTLLPIVSQLGDLTAKFSGLMLTTDSTLEKDISNLKSFNRKYRKLKRRLAKVSYTCQKKKSALGYQSEWLTLGCAWTSAHDPQCRLSALQNTVTDLQLRTTLCSLFLGWKVSFSLKLACGAGSPFKQTLECHRVVATTSPAFSFIPDLVKSSRTNTEEVFRGEVNKLLEMFQLGQASPLDRLPDGTTLLHELVHHYGLSMSSGCDHSLNWNKNLLYLILTVIPRMSTEAFETNDSGQTIMDVLMRSARPRLWHQEDSVANALLIQGFQITRHTVQTSSLSSWQTIIYVDHQSESSTDVRLDENELVEAILSRSDHQLRYYLRQSKDMRILDASTVIFALRLATMHGWIDGCKTMLEADVMETLEKGFLSPEDYTLLGSLAYTKRLEMMQLWLMRRADFGKPQLRLIGYAEDVSDSHECGSLPEFREGIAYNVSSYLRDLRHEIDLLVKKHGIDYCCDSARNNLPDAHVKCMLTALVSKGIEVPQYYWPKRRSLYHRKVCWCPMERLVFERQENDGFREISGKDFRCSMKSGCSPLVYFLTQLGPYFNDPRGALNKRDMAVNWFLSRGADLRETWPGSDITAMHCLAWQSAEHLNRFSERLSKEWDTPIQSIWDYRSFEPLVKGEILDSCECGCSISGCDFLTCFWKEFFTKYYAWNQFSKRAYRGKQFSVICDCLRGANPTGEVKANVLLNITVWVDRAANTLKLHQPICSYIRLFVFSYLELRHTCCDIGHIEHEDNPDYSKQPYPRYFPKEGRRIENEDATLRGILEELVPMFISQFDAVGGRLEDFVVDLMIPKMRKVAKELKEEDAALYGKGRREMGVVMYEDEEEAAQSESSDEEEEQDEVIEEESDDEY